MRNSSDGAGSGHSRGGRWKISACPMREGFTRPGSRGKLRGANVRPALLGIGHRGASSARYRNRTARLPQMATAGHIRVTPEQLGAIAGQLNAGAANIEQINQQLQGQVAPLGSDWAGVAQARFHELWAEWQRSSQGIQHALQGISQLMTQASANYADTEAAIANTFQR